MNRLGPYVLLRRIGLGGMAEIFLARREGPAGFAKVCALKRILPHLADQPDFVAMFLDEARLAARLSHPHIVQIYDFGQADNHYFIAMEYVAGEDLLNILRRARDVNLPVPPVIGAAILVAACDALHHAHELYDEHRQPLGIVHRDVTPSNLMISYDGVVKLTDFGIAKASRRDAHTAIGALKGKYAYMAPEHAMGEAVDRRADVFSLGIVGHELMTGKRLFHRDNEMKVLQAVTQEPIPRPSDRRMDLPREIDAILLRALERDPTKRFPSAKAFGLALEEFLLANGEAGARLQLARYLRQLFGEDAAQERHRWAVGDLQDGESTAAAAPAAPAAAPPDARVHALAAQEELTDGIVIKPRGSGARGLVIVSSVLALGTAAGIALFGGGGKAKATDPPPPLVAATPAPAGAVAVDPASPLEGPQLSVARPAKSVARPAPAEAFLSVRVAEAVDVFLDDKPLGAAPLARAKITAGKHTLALAGREAGFRVEWPIEVAAGAEHVEERTLARGKLTVEGPRGALVFDGTRKLGRVPLADLPLTEGAWSLTLRKGKREKAVRVDVRAGKVTRVKEKW